MKALRALHATLRQAGLTDDETKRALYERVTGKRSAKDMTEAEIGAVITELKRLYPALNSASKRRPDGRRKLPDTPLVKKCQALWIAGWNLGVFENGDDGALVKFVQRQTKLDHIRFMRDGRDASKVIDALKAWLTREAGVDWSVGEHTRLFERVDGYKIARAQWALLPADRFSRKFHEVVSDMGMPVSARVTNADWRHVMNEFGKDIRAAKAAKKAVA